MPGRVRNVFVSHIHEDDAGVGKLTNLLAKAGYSLRDGSITADKPNAATNPDYIKSAILAPRINWAGALIVYITPNTKTSAWVNWEIDYAVKAGKPIIGVWGHGAGDCDAPESLENYAQAVEVGWNTGRIIDALEGRLTEWRNPDDSSRGARNIKRVNC